MVSDLCAWAFTRGVEAIGKATYEERFDFHSSKEAEEFIELTKKVNNILVRWTAGSKAVVVVHTGDDA